jgi:O-glycosyl hydrolase
MDPAFAAQYWQQHMNPLKDKGYTLISPATVAGPAWMTAFLKACNGQCKMDALALHWYGVDPAQLTKYLQDFHDQFNMPIWLTEVGCQSFTGGAQCNSGQVWALMNALKAFESTSWFETWCWFGAMHDMTNVSYLNQLMAGDGSPNALGNDFLY